MPTEIETLAAIGKQNADGLTALTKSFGQLIDKLSRPPAEGFPGQSEIFGSPNVRRGENTMTSRGFSFMKMLGLITGACDPKDATVELAVHDKLSGSYKDNYNYGGMGTNRVHRFLAPLSTGYMEHDVVDTNFRREMKSLVRAGVDGADFDHMNWIRRKQLQEQGYGQKALSWLNELTGGALVAPPEMGELIELLRNKEALVNAGARVVPLPPQGRLKYPRQTAPSTTYWVGENMPITESVVGTGEVTLQAKKLAVLIKAPNELIRFASPAAEALLRDDMTKSLALGLDLAGLEGL